MNPAYLSAFSALAGSAIGALSSLGTTWLTQRFQYEAERRGQESARREKLYGDFIDEASRLFADALVHSLDDPSKLVQLYAIKGKVRLFATLRTTACADAVMEMIVKTYYSPNQDFQDRDAVEGHALNILADFIEAGRADLGSH